MDPSEQLSLFSVVGVARRMDPARPKALPEVVLLIGHSLARSDEELRYRALNELLQELPRNKGYYYHDIRLDELPGYVPYAIPPEGIGEVYEIQIHPRSREHGVLQDSYVPQPIFDMQRAVTSTYNYTCGHSNNPDDCEFAYDHHSEPYALQTKTSSTACPECGHPELQP